MKLIKKIKRIFISSSIVFGLMFVVGNVCAQEITAINFNGEPVGKVIPDGKVVGFENNLLGSVTADSLLIDSNGFLIGGVVPQGIAIGNDAKILGKVGSDGTVRGGTEPRRGAPLHRETRKEERRCMMACGGKKSGGKKPPKK